MVNAQNNTDNIQWINLKIVGQRDEKTEKSWTVNTPEWTQPKRAEASRVPEIQLSLLTGLVIILTVRNSWERPELFDFLLEIR